MARRKNSAYRDQRYYTTHQVAKHLGVSLPTVVNWVKSGLLPAHRTPGGHRRIARTDILAFARQHDYPISRELAELDGPARVLVVDDEQDFAEMVRDYLVLKGDLRVEVADSGFQAGFAVARFKPDIILMDIMMPDMDGFEVYRLLREDADTRHIPVIACTAYRDPDIDRRVQTEGFAGFVEKPLKLDSLLTLIQRSLGTGTAEVEAR